MSAEQYVHELHGYLQALQRLCGTDFAFGAEFYSCREDVENFGMNISQTRIEYVKVEYTEILEGLLHMVFNGMLSKKRIPTEKAWQYLTQVIVDDISEYFGLVSTALNKKGVFHPLLKGTIYKNIMPFRGDAESLIYWIEIEGHFVLAYFRKIKRPD